MDEVTAEIYESHRDFWIEQAIHIRKKLEENYNHDGTLWFGDVPGRDQANGRITAEILRQMGG